MAFSPYDSSQMNANVTRQRLRVHSQFALCLYCCLSGCGNSDGVTEPATPVARRTASSLETPLSAEEIRTFLEIVHDLPAGKAPDFVPLAYAAVDDRLPAETLVTAYRREYVRQFDPVEQARQWSRDHALMSVLTAHGMTPEEFAALMTRVGCALAAGTVNSRMNVAEASDKADRHLQQIIARIDQWDQRAAQGTASLRSVAQRRQPLVDQLKDLVALSEFSRILLSVPTESRAAIERHKDELTTHLPRSGDVRLFERTFNAEAVIVPASHERSSQRPSSQ